MKKLFVIASFLVFSSAYAGGHLSAKDRKATLECAGLYYANSMIPQGTLELDKIPVGTTIHCVELKPLKGAQLARSAGTSVQFVAKEDGYASIRLKSGEFRKVLTSCRATIGEVSNQEHSLKSFGKAGAKRWIGVRPTVRGVAMNPIDHPHGGGEGRTSGGRHPVTPWGVSTKGKKTRRNKKTNVFIIKRRKK